MPLVICPCRHVHRGHIFWTSVDYLALLVPGWFRHLSFIKVGIPTNESSDAVRELVWINIHFHAVRKISSPKKGS